MSKEAGLAPEIAAAIPALREHLRKLVESPAFKGSRRGQQFLEHIVEKALAGHGDQLKERNLGVELFGRDPSYDTGEDAIVRVTASDVRRRLHLFYSETDSAIRIDIPSGTYTPEFHCVPGRELMLDREPPHPEPAPLWKHGGWWRRVALAGLLVAAVAFSAGWLRQRHRAASLSPLQVLPWSVLFLGDRPLQIVLSDPDLSAIQELTGSPVSLSDYANQRYLTNPGAFGGDTRRVLSLLRGVNVAAVDAGIIASISRLAGASPTRLKINTARSLQLSALKTDDHLLILGSPRSDPWGELFADQLDFEFQFDPAIHGEIIRNKRTRPGELPRYVPTARGWDTGHVFAMIALVGNPNQAGKVLLVAGTSAEGTEAAGQLVANSAEFARTLRANGIDPAGPPCHFQILLQVRTMAGSPSRSEVLACHRLP
jgi:hypothetical protein